MLVLFPIARLLLPFPRFTRGVSVIRQNTFSLRKITPGEVLYRLSLRGPTADRKRPKYDDFRDYEGIFHVVEAGLVKA